MDPMLLAMAGCAAPQTDLDQPPAPPDDPAVIAVYADGQVTAADLDREVLGLPAQARQQGLAEDPGAWYEELIRELVVDCLLAAEAELLVCCVISFVGKSAPGFRGFRSRSWSR